jgi:hypothetical protein
MDLHVYRNSADRWHDLRAAARASGAVLGANAVTIDELVQRLTPEAAVATPGQRLALVDSAVAGAAPLRYVYEAFAEVKAAGMRPANLRSAGAAELAGFLETYDGLLAKHALCDPQDRLWTAAARLPGSGTGIWIERFDSVVLHALYDLNDAQFALLRSLIERLPGGGTVMLFNATVNVRSTQFAEWTWQRFIRDEALADKTFPEFFRSSSPASAVLERLFVFDSQDRPDPLPPRDSLRILQCAGRYREIESIGSELAGLLARGLDPGEAAVVVRHIETYGEMIEDVFSRYGIPHAFETGVPLLRIPFIKYWMSLVDLVAGDRPRELFARVLGSAYANPRLTPKYDPERVLEDVGYIDRRHLRASTLAARRNSPLTPALERFEAVLDGLEQASLSPARFLARLPPQAALSGRDRQAWSTLREEIEAADLLTGEMTFSRFRLLASEIAALRTADRLSASAAAPGVARVRIMPPHALGYRSYRYLYAPGFADGEIPAPAAKNPLLPDDVVEALNKTVKPGRILTSRQRNRREPLHLFMVLDSASERATLTWPGSTLEGEPIYPSIYIGEVLRHFDPQPSAIAGPPQPLEPGEYLREVARAWRSGAVEDSHAAELLGAGIVGRAALERRGAFRADVAASSVPVDGAWSPSELNALAACPFVFLARYRLGIRPPGLPDFEVPAREVGSLAHEILREFYVRPVPESEDEARTRMQEVLTRKLARVDIDGQGPSTVIDPSLWKIRRPQLVRALLEYVRFAVSDAREGYETLAEYLDLPLPQALLGETLLKGKPDHVAVRRAGGRLTHLRIDDFKYSAASSATGRQLQQSVQIPVYAHLAARALNAEPGVQIEGRYILLRSPSTPVLSHGVDTVVLDELRRKIEVLVAKVRSGRLHPDPADRSDCAECDYRRLCRLYGS